MLSDRAYYLMNFCINNFIARFGIFPMAWCPKSRNLIPSKKAKNRAIFNFSLIFIWCLFSSGQIIRFYVAKDYNNLNLLLMYSFGAFICCEAMGVCVFQTDACIGLGNAMLGYLKHINRKSNLYPKASASSEGFNFATSLIFRGISSKLQPKQEQTRNNHRCFTFAHWTICPLYYPTKLASCFQISKTT